MKRSHIQEERRKLVNPDIRDSACGSCHASVLRPSAECRGFDSVRAPQEKSPEIREIAGLLHF